MTLRRRSLLGSRCSPLKSPRRTAQTIHRRAMLQTVKQLTRPSADSNSTGGKVAFGAASKANLKVVVRVRPLNEKELEKNANSVIQVVDEHMLVFDPKIEEDVFFYHGVKQRRDITKRQHKDQKFMFERIFGADSTNQDVFESTTKDIIDTLLEGYNCSVFAYGATGAGKTFTMVGRPECPGITLLTLMELYARIEAMEAEDGGTSIEVAVSYLEVYNEMVRDLLQPGKPLQVQDSGQQVLVPGLSFHKPRDAEHLMELLALGNCNRSQHPTDANAESSRSHAVFQVMVKQQVTSSSGAAKSNVSIAKLSMIDLAGSERAASTGCKGVRFREGANINKSLLALGNCINALADGKSHIPYRDSKLTRLLKDSLGGNCRSVMVAAVSMASTTFEDTFNTLRYSNRAKTIKTTLKKNQLSVDTHVSAYVKIVEALKQETLELRVKLEQSEQREAEQQRQAEQYEETIADLKRQLLEARENVAPSLLSSADNTHDGSSLAEAHSSANIGHDTSSCTSLAEPLSSPDGIFPPDESTSPVAACCSTTADSDVTVYPSTTNSVRGSGCSCPCSCQDAMDSAGDKARAAEAAAEVAGLHREALQLQSDERQVHLKLHITKLKRSRLDIIAFAAYKLAKSVRKLANFEEELLERSEQTRQRLTAVTARLSSGRPEKEDSERIQRQEVSLLRSLVHDALHEVHESDCVQRVLLKAVRGLHVHLHSTSQHSQDTQHLFQSVVSCLDEYRIAWADQQEPQFSATTTSCSLSGASNGGEGTVEEGRDGLPTQQASSGLPWLDVSWLTHIRQDGALQQSPAVVSCTATHQLNTVRKSIMKGSSSTVSLCDVHTSPVLVHSITESAEQLRQSTLANTISNQRLNIAHVDSEAAVKAVAASSTSLAQLVVVTTAATSVTSSDVATTRAACSLANRGVVVNVTCDSRTALLQNIGSLNLPVMSQPRYVPATPVLRFPPPIIEETSPPALPGISCISEYSRVYKSSPTEVTVTEATNFAETSCSDASSSSIAVLPRTTIVNSSLTSFNSLLNSHKRMSMQRQSSTRNLILSADGALAATASDATHDIPAIGCPGGFVSMLAGVPSGLDKPECCTTHFSQTFSLTPDTDDQKALDSRLVKASLSDGRNVNSLSTDLNNSTSIPYSLVPSCLNATMDLPTSTSGLYCNKVKLNIDTPSSGTVTNPLVSSSTYNVNVNSQHLKQNDVLNSTYVTSDVDDTVSVEQDVGVSKVTARQLLFTSPSTSSVGGQQAQQMKNSTLCIDSTEDAEADGCGVLGSDPLSLLDAVPTAPSASAAAGSSQMKLKGILKNASISSVASLAVPSQHHPDAPPPSCRPLYRSQSVRDSGGGRTIGGGGGYTRGGAPLPEKSHAMRRILSFKARRLNGTRSNQENVTPSHGAPPGEAPAHPHSAGKLSAPCNKLSASVSCSNLSTVGVGAPGGGVRLLPSTSVSNLTGVGAGGRGGARTVSSWRP